MRTLSKKSSAIVASAALIGLVGSGVAYAFWTTGGSGDGSAATGTAASITVHQLSVPTGLTPGGTGVGLSGNFTNNNTAAVEIASVTAAVTSITNGGSLADKPLCATSDYKIEGESLVNMVPAGDGVGAWSGLTIRLINRLDAGGVPVNQDNCKNAVANITYTAN